MNEDIYDTIFENLLRLLRQGMDDLNIKFLARWWHLSTSLGSRGQVIAEMLAEESLDLFQKVKLSNLQLGIVHRGFEDVVTLWRLQRLASLLLEGNEAKLRKLCLQSEYRNVYHLLGRKLEKEIKDEKTFILYAYFRVLTVSRDSVDLQAMTRRYVSRSSGFQHRTEIARHLRISIEHKLRKQDRIFFLEDKHCK